MELILFKFLLGLITLSCMSTDLESATLPSTSSTSFGNETDRLALLDFKKSITKDPLSVMNSWNDSVDFCSWIGITCNPSTKRVVILNLRDQQLAGSIPPSIGNLSFLTGISLRKNFFHGEIPPEMGRLQGLRHLNLSANSFGGKIPANISHCTQLKVLQLASNKLIGSIPDQLSSLLDLSVLFFDGNNLTGAIPSWIGNFSSLSRLYLSRNNFQGSIPNELGRLKSLREISLDLNNLTGMVPSSIYNLSLLNTFSVVQNQLHGELPPDVGTTLPNLEEFLGGMNNFTGSIPTSLSNASRLQILDFAYNDFTGAFPAESLGSLQSLVKINFEVNRLGSGKDGGLNFFSFLANCTSLVVLGFDHNNFGGEIPRSIGNLSTQLTALTLGTNLLYGSIPDSIANLVNLTLLGMEHNNLGGSVPDAIGKLHKLGGLYLIDNKFSGLIPVSLGNLTSLARLHMEENRFEGSIPPTLGNCQKLLALNLSSNKLTGPIPKEILQLSSLSIYLGLSNNSLTGSLLSEVGYLVNLAELDVSGNKLSGDIPTALGSCVMVRWLHLGENRLEGTIPQSLVNLRSLEEVDMSYNNLSGQIPEFLGTFTFLKSLNLSYNDFEGELPEEGIFSNASNISIIGNQRLCGGIAQFHLPLCSGVKRHSSERLLALKVVIPIACALAFIIALSCFVVARSKVKKSRGRLGTSPSYKDWKSGVSYSNLVESTNGFSPDNLIGSGSFGSVYKGVLPTDGTVVAVKVLNLHQQGASKSFIDECRALRSIRHRNLLKIITACSSIDNQGNDFKSLVFEFMENGSLEMWLHPKDDEQSSQSKRLSLVQRLDIATGIASALDYLHNHCETSIIHCDLKPSNILLDQDMVPHVGDFGLARFLFEDSDNPPQIQTLSAGLKGTIGYIPPEYGMGGQVSIMGDIYSYGILLLEMFTGKRPTDDVFGDGISIHQFAAMAMPDHVMGVVDPLLLGESEDVDPVQSRRLEECLVSVMKIGLSCCATSPGERMLMGVVVNKMKAARNSYLDLGKTS